VSADTKQCTAVPGFWSALRQVRQHAYKPKASFAPQHDAIKGAISIIAKRNDVCQTVRFLQRAAMLALQALYYSNSVCPSVCLSVCLSVTRRYSVKKTARSTVQFGLSDSKMCLIL